MSIFETLAPLVLLIALGAGLARIRFLGREFMADLNKLAFWITLPALLFVSASRAAEPGGQTVRLVGILVAGTLIITLVAWVVSLVLRLPPATRGTFMQSAFRGNVAYIAIPVLASSLGKTSTAFATAVVALVLLMATYNVLAVLVLQQGSLVGADWGRVARSIITNPLLLAGLSGLIVPALGLTLPGFVDHALTSLGAAAVPIALLCIGGALATTSLQGRLSWIVAVAILKVVVLPLFTYGLAVVWGLGPEETRIALVLSACPTAAAAFIMAKQMGGDEALASGSIALSTVFSAVSLVVALWVTGG